MFLYSYKPTPKQMQTSLRQQSDASTAVWYTRRRHIMSSAPESAVNSFFWCQENNSHSGPKQTRPGYWKQFLPTRYTVTRSRVDT